MTNELTPTASDVYENTPKQNSPGHFSLYSRPKEVQNRKVASYIRKKFLATDYEEGYVYVAKDADTGFCKVGFSRRDADARIKAIEKCKIHTNSSLRVGPLKGAFRVERLVLSLLEHRCHPRQQCQCGLQNLEWFEEDYEKVILQVEIVYNWMQNEPYELLEGEMTLKGVWSDALDKWRRTQETELPWSWNEFFIMGPFINVSMGGLCYHIPTSDAEKSHSSTRQFGKQFLHLISGLKHNKGSIKKLKRAKARLTKRAHIHDGASVSPPPNAHVSHQEEIQDRSEDADIWDTVDEYADSTPSKRPHSRPSNRSSAAKVAHADVDNPIEYVTPQKQNCRLDLRNRSPLQSFEHDRPTTSSPMTVCEFQQSSPELILPQDIDGRLRTEENGTGRATYHHEVTLRASGNGDTPRKWSDPTSVISDPIHSLNDDCKIFDIVERMARMPGAFPDDEVDNPSYPEWSMVILPKAPFSTKDYVLHEVVDKELHTDAWNIAGTRTFLVDENNFIVLVPGSPPIAEDLLLYGARCMFGIALLSCDDNDSLSVKRFRHRAASGNPGMQAGRAETAGPIPTTKNLRDNHDGLAFANQNDFARRLGLTLEHNMPPAICPTNAFTSKGQPALSCGGTARFPFRPVLERDFGFGGQYVYYQTICHMLRFSKFSFEELRLADYNAGLRFAPQAVVEDDKVSSEDGSTTEARQKDGSPFASSSKSSAKPSLFSSSSTYTNPTSGPNVFGFQFGPAFFDSNGFSFDFTPDWRTAPLCTAKPSVIENKIFSDASYELIFKDPRSPGKTSWTIFHNKPCGKAGGNTRQNTFFGEAVDEDDNEGRPQRPIARVKRTKRSGIATDVVEQISRDSNGCNPTNGDNQRHDQSKGTNEGLGHQMFQGGCFKAEDFVSQKWTF